MPSYTHNPYTFVRRQNEQYNDQLEFSFSASSSSSSSTTTTSPSSRCGAMTMVKKINNTKEINMMKIAATTSSPSSSSEESSCSFPCSNTTTPRTQQQNQATPSFSSSSSSSSRSSLRNAFYPPPLNNNNNNNKNTFSVSSAKQNQQAPPTYNNNNQTQHQQSTSSSFDFDAYLYHLVQERGLTTKEDLKLQATYDDLGVDAPTQEQRSKWWWRNETSVENQFYKETEKLPRLPPPTLFSRMVSTSTTNNNNNNNNNEKKNQNEPKRDTKYSQEIFQLVHGERKDGFSFRCCHFTQNAPTTNNLNNKNNNNNNTLVDFSSSSSSTTCPSLLATPNRYHETYVNFYSSSYDDENENDENEYKYKYEEDFAPFQYQNYFHNEENGNNDDDSSDWSSSTPATSPSSAKRGVGEKMISNQYQEEEITTTPTSPSSAFNNNHQNNNLLFSSSSQTQILSNKSNFVTPPSSNKKPIEIQQEEQEKNDNADCFLQDDDQNEDFEAITTSRRLEFQQQQSFENNNIKINENLTFLVSFRSHQEYFQVLSSSNTNRQIQIGDHVVVQTEEEKEVATKNNNMRNVLQPPLPRQQHHKQQQQQETMNNNINIGIVSKILPRNSNNKIQCSSASKIVAFATSEQISILHNDRQRESEMAMRFLDQLPYDLIESRNISRKYKQQSDARDQRLRERAMKMFDEEEEFHFDNNQTKNKIPTTTSSSSLSLKELRHANRDPLLALFPNAPPSESAVTEILHLYKEYNFLNVEFSFDKKSICVYFAESRRNFLRTTKLERKSLEKNKNKIGKNKFCGEQEQEQAGTGFLNLPSCFYINGDQQFGEKSSSSNVIPPQFSFFMMTLARKFSCKIWMINCSKTAKVLKGHPFYSENHEREDEAIVYSRENVEEFETRRNNKNTFGMNKNIFRK